MRLKRWSRECQGVWVGHFWQDHQQEWCNFYRDCIKGGWQPRQQTQTTMQWTLRPPSNYLRVKPSLPQSMLVYCCHLSWCTVWGKQVKFNVDPGRAVCTAARVTLNVNVFSDLAKDMFGQSKSEKKTFDCSVADESRNDDLKGLSMYYWCVLQGLGSQVEQTFNSGEDMIKWSRQPTIWSELESLQGSWVREINGQDQQHQGFDERELCPHEFSYQIPLLLKEFDNIVGFSLRSAPELEQSNYTEARHKWMSLCSSPTELCCKLV